MMAKPSYYKGSRVALLTQHGKERVIAPVLEPGLGCSIELVTGFDTDQFGTFTRETPRNGTQLEAARRKARKGMELARASQGIASEGSFGPDPHRGRFRKRNLKHVKPCLTGLYAKLTGERHVFCHSNKSACVPVRTNTIKPCFALSSSL